MYRIGFKRKYLASTPTLFSSSCSEDHCFKKIIEEQSLLIQTQKDHLQHQGDLIGKMNIVVHYLATRDSAVTTIFQTSTMPSKKFQGSNHDFEDDSQAV